MEKVEKFIRSARQLEVYKKAYQVSLGIHKATLTFPKIEQFALADQMRRSSKSICANLSEGFAKQAHSKPEFARFISMAIGSASEIETWICYAYDLGYIDKKTLNAWLEQYGIVLSMLVKLREKL